MNNDMNKEHRTSSRAPRQATILGITGGYGGAMARELIGRGFRLKALVRRPEAVPADLSASGVELITGDLFDTEALARAVDGSEILVHGINPTYDKWDPFVCDAARVVADAAANAGATILFPGNVYAYAPTVGIDEATPAAPPTEKGRIRIAAEAILTEATTRGARLIILRGGDFFGGGLSGQSGQSSWMSQVLSRARKGGAILLPGPSEVRHQWAYLPDFVRAHVDLIETALEPAATFHFEGHVLSGQELADAIREALGEPERSVRAFPWWLTVPIAWFSPVLREVRKMRYLWDTELVMDGARLQSALGTVAQTPIVDAVRHDLACGS